MQEQTFLQRVGKLLIGFWLLVFIPLAITTSQVVEQLPRKTFPQSLYDTSLGWFFLPGINLTLTVSVLGTLLLLTIVVSVLSLRQAYSKSSRALRRYLKLVVDTNKGLSPRGLSQQSQVLISVNVPLDSVYIHLSAVPDRPVYDLPQEQQKQLEALRQRADAGQGGQAELEETIHDLRRIWASQGLTELQGKRNASIEDVLQQLTPASPVSVILGAPGSGKSTTLRWFALHMAQAALLPRYRRWLRSLLHVLASIPFLRSSDEDDDDHWHLPFLRIPSRWGELLPAGLAPVQFPILLRIGEYASNLSTEPELSFEQFFSKRLGDELATRLLAELEQGHCLLLFDGLDEVASDSLRRRAAEHISAFIAGFSVESNRQHYNRFVITSRIVGYNDVSTFTKYAHYTLQDFDDEQIERFLTNWCPAVEGYQVMFAQGMKVPSAQQQIQIQAAGSDQKERLLRALRNNPSMKRLAVNPLMLTILAVIQKNGKTLPHRRIDLYEVVTRTLLDNWNQESGRRMLPAGEIQLADRLLAALAYRMHSRDPLMTEREVRQVACPVMSDFYKRPSSDEDADQFIDVLRSSSGLFVESGQGWFSFMHRTFQEYYVALYLLDKHNYPADKLKDCMCEYYVLPVWREPLLLAIAYKSGQRDRDEQQQASTLIQAIMGTRDNYESVLQRSLLFAANSIVDCNPWSVETDLQRRVAHELFALYGDNSDTGRYTALQQDIEEVTLLWLRGQSQESSQHGTWTPLLEIWRGALCDPPHPLRQEGATHLLAALAPDLASCLGSVLTALVPPLLQLADVLDMPYPPAIGEHLPWPAAQSATQKITEYALVALRLLDKDGPAGWLHKAWQAWNTEQPELLERLTRHALDIDYLLTPAALPEEYHYPNWSIQDRIYREWQKLARDHPRDVQVQLLQASNAARYPHAFLFRQLLTQEVQAPSAHYPWQELWNDWLKTEMTRGRDATYQASLSLRLLLRSGNAALRGEIATELMVALSSPSNVRTQALMTITNLYLLGLRYMRDLRYMRVLRDMQGLRDMLDMRDLQDLLDLQDLRDMQGLRDLLDREQIVERVCNILIQQATEDLSLTLFAVYSVLTSYPNDEIPLATTQRIQGAISVLKQPAQALTVEQRQLIAVIERRLHPASPSSSTQHIQSIPDVRAANLYAFKQQRQLTAAQVKELVNACADSRSIPQDKREAVGYADTVQEAAWGLLGQQLSLDEQAAMAALQALDDDEALVCAAAARLLQGCKTLSLSVKEEAAQKIMRLLADETLSRRPLDMLDYAILRLDDVLFETLRGMV